MFMKKTGGDVIFNILRLWLNEFLCYRLDKWGKQNSAGPEV